MATTTPRQRARSETEAQIIRMGNQMVDADGVEGLSLRAIARELGIVSSAVYRYVASRDELLTVLIQDAFTSIADEVEHALEKERSALVIGLTMLEWSHRFPNRWTLIYGTPIPDYHAPREVTVVPGTRIAVLLAELLADRPTPRTAVKLPSDEALEPLREGLQEVGTAVDDQTIMTAVTVWVAIIGLINALRFGQFGPGFASVEDELMRGLITTLEV